MQLVIDFMQRGSVLAQKTDIFHSITVREKFYRKERNQSVSGSQKYLIIKTRL